ncbi:MAG: hypothetical protein M3025_01940, partial [Actinomycetota bacterium]|nr:hypothetical protein [Actinomycetota bacterium]
TPGGAAAGSYPLTIRADNGEPNPATQTLTLTVAAPPRVKIVAPAARKYRRGSVVRASYSCHDGAGGTGISSCTGTKASGHRINTSKLGVHSFTVTAVSADGLRSTVTITYRVIAKRRHPRHHRHH